jgi:hypothetical protein
MAGKKTSTPYLYETPSGYRVIGKQGKNTIDQYFKKNELQKAKLAAKNFSKKLSEALKGFITRQDLASQIGITDSGLEKAKAANTALWKSITDKMEVKTVGSREYYKYKGNKAESLKEIKTNSGSSGLGKPRKLYRGEVNAMTKVKDILTKSKTPLTIKEVQNKLPNTPEATVNNAFARLKKTDLKNKIKLITPQEIADAGAKTKAAKREPFIKIVRDVFVKDPDATTADVAEAMVGTKKYNSASLTSKYNYDTAARKNIVKFLEVVGTGSKQKVKGFKDIEPDKLGDILESIESRISEFGFESGPKREVQLAIADAAKGLPPRTGEELLKSLRSTGSAVDHVIPLASVFRDAPGYTEAGQVIDFNINKKKGNTLDADFGKAFKKVLKGDFSSVDNYNKKALDFASANNVDTPLIRIGNNLNPKDYVANFDNFSEGAKQNIIDLSKEKGFVIQTKTKTLAMLNEGTNQLINSTEKLTKPEQIKFCKFLSNGGLPGDCKQAIKKDPEKAAKILSEAPVTSAAMNSVKKDSQKLIRLFRGEGFNLRTGPSIKEMAKTFNVSEAEAKKKLLSGQWFTSDPVAASSYTDKLGKTKYVDVTPREFLNFKKYVDRVNKTKSLSGGERFPVNTKDKLSIVPRYKLKEFEEANRLKSQRNFFKKFNLKTGYAERPPGVLTYDSVLGGFVDSKYPTQKVSDLQIKNWATENPMPVKAGTEDALKPIKGNLLKTVGKSLAYVGAPLPTALIDTYFIGKQIAEDRPAAEIAKDPLNWLGLATMSTLSEISGVTKPGKMNAALRLGMSPGLIRGVSRFAGLPGLAISTALTAYDQYNKYKNEEGLIYNLFNDKAKAV